MAKQVYLVYETDAWLTTKSKELMAVCETEEDAINLILENHQLDPKDYYELEEDDDMEEVKADFQKELRRELEEMGQTQCHPTNYLIEAWTMGEW